MSLVDAADEKWPEQQDPIKNDNPAVWDLVLKDLDRMVFDDSGKMLVRSALIEDIHLRDATGEKKYGVRLQPFNGRNFVQDAYEEALDSIVYLRGAIQEKNGPVIVTQHNENMRYYLNSMYVAQIQIALGLRHILYIEKEMNESTSNTSNS
jgi:hypothetical protein